MDTVPTGASSAAFRSYAFVLMIICAVDLAFNSSLEFDQYSHTDTPSTGSPTPGEDDGVGGGGSGTMRLVLLVTVHVFLQIAGIIALILLVSSTYPYQIGVLAPIARHFGPPMAAHTVYIIFTVVLGLHRVVRDPKCVCLTPSCHSSARFS